LLGSGGRSFPCAKLNSSATLSLPCRSWPRLAAAGVATGASVGRESLLGPTRSNLPSMERIDLPAAAPPGDSAPAAVLLRLLLRLPLAVGESSSAGPAVRDGLGWPPREAMGIPKGPSPSPCDSEAGRGGDVGTAAFEVAAFDTAALFGDPLLLPVATPPGLAVDEVAGSVRLPNHFPKPLEALVTSYISSSSSKSGASPAPLAPNKLLRSGKSLEPAPLAVPTDLNDAL